MGVQFSVSYPVPVMKARLVRWINERKYWQPALSREGEDREDAWVVNAADVLGLRDHPAGMNLYLRAKPCILACQQHCWIRMGIGWQRW